MPARGFKKGQSGNPAGRPAGKPNKATAEIRDAVQKIVEWAYTDGTRSRAKQWLEKVGADDPAKALSITIQLAEFVLPKLQRFDGVIEERQVLQPPIVIIQPPSDEVLARPTTNTSRS